MDRTDGPDIVLRDETKEDQAFLTALHRGAILQAMGAVGGEGDPTTAALADMQLRARSLAYAANWPAAWRRTAWLGGERVGAIITSRGPESVHVVDMAVAPSRRRRGVGRAMLDRIAGEADGMGLEATARILVSNAASRALFAAAGFEGECAPGDAQINVRRSRICDPGPSLRPGVV